MTDNVIQLFPADDFKVVCDNAQEQIRCGMILGYDDEGHLIAYGGGLLDGKAPVAKDWLWLTEQFKLNLLRGDYA